MYFAKSCTANRRQSLRSSQSASTSGCKISTVSPCLKKYTGMLLSVDIAGCLLDCLAGFYSSVETHDFEELDYYALQNELLMGASFLGRL